MESVPMWLWEAVYSETGTAIGSLLILFVGGGVCLLIWRIVLAVLDVYKESSSARLVEMETKLTYQLQAYQELNVRLNLTTQEVDWLRKRVEDENAECDRRINVILDVIKRSDRNRLRSVKDGQG